MVAQPSIPFDQSYFTGGVDTSGRVFGFTDYGSGLTYLLERPPALVDGYVTRLAVAGKTVLVVGCAYGLSVQALRARGVTAYGMDVSSWAIGQAPADTAPFLLVGDARVSSSWSAARNLAGLKGKTLFDVVIVEDVDTCWSDADAAAVAGLARQFGKLVVHLIDTGVSADWYNVHDLAGWKALFGSDQVVQRFTWVVA